MDENPYQAPAEPAAQRWAPLKTLKRCGLIYLAAFPGVAFAHVMGAVNLSSIAHEHPAAVAAAGFLGLAAAVAWLVADDRRAKR